jgi:hypothetical protein
MSLPADTQRIAQRFGKENRTACLELSEQTRRRSMDAHSLPVDQAREGA